MSGEQKSAKDRLAGIQKTLDEYTTRAGLSSIVYNSDVDNIIKLTRDEMRGMSPEDLGECSYVLAQYATYVQFQYNRHDFITKWASRELDEIIAMQADNYSGTGKDKTFIKYEILRGKIVRGDGAASQLNEIIKHAEARSVQLSNLSSKLHTMGNHLVELQKTKRWKK